MVQDFILMQELFLNNQKPMSLNPIINMEIVAIIELMLWVGITFLIEYLDSTLKTDQNVDGFLGLPIISLISPILLKKSKITNESNNRCT